MTGLKVWRDTRVMIGWQLTVDARNPRLLMKFWAPILGYEPTEPDDPYVHRIVDPAGHGPPIWFQKVPEPKAGKNRLHIDVYPTGRDCALPIEERRRIVEARVEGLVGAGAS